MNKQCYIIELSWLLDAVNVAEDVERKMKVAREAFRKTREVFFLHQVMSLILNI